MRRHKLITLAVSAGLLGSLGAASPAAAQSGTCTASFHVLHNDRIGNLSMPEGTYTLTTAGGVSCARASHLFAEFLTDFNGDLRRPWRYSVLGVGNGRFTASGGRSFTARRTGDSQTVSAPGPVRAGGGSHGDLRCPGTFRVQNNDRIGQLRLPRGNYKITLLGGRISCATAVSNFRTFLQRPLGNLPGGYIVLPRLAEFIQGSTKDGFRVKRES